MKTIPFTTIAVLLLLAVSSFAAAIQLPRTGQTTPFAAGDDGTLQKGAAVSGLRFSDNANGTVTDNLTGLVWLKNAHCNFGDTATPAYILTWFDALVSANRLTTGICDLRDGSKAGDWRLPNAVELESLVDIAHAVPALPVGHPFTGVQSNVYWTSTSSARNPASAWAVQFDSGMEIDFSKDLSYSFWAVRSGQAGSIQYLLSSFHDGAGSGAVTSNPAGISCTGSCAAFFDASTQVTLIPAASFDSYFAGWSGGGCGGSGNCQVSMNSDNTVTSTFAVHLPVNLGTSYFPLIGAALPGAGAGSVLRIRAVELTESPRFSNSADITLIGGFDGAFTSASAFTRVRGTVTVSAGPVTFENLIIL